MNKTEIIGTDNLCAYCEKHIIGGSRMTQFFQCEGRYTEQAEEEYLEQNDIKVLTVRQPYASLIVEGIKDVENRTRKTNYRGRLLIHAGLQLHDRMPDMDKLFTQEQQRFLKSSNMPGLLLKVDRVKAYKEFLPLGAIIGEVELVDCVQDSNSHWAEEGAYHWVLKKPILYKQPLTGIKGSLGLWNLK